jgi:hypothetical protein
MIPIHLSLEEVAMHVGGKVMTKIDHTSAPIDQASPVHLINNNNYLY